MITDHGIEKNRTRFVWVDTIRCLACIWVIFTHFAAQYGPAYLPGLLTCWQEGEILCGITGKLAVSVFSVFLGYFAASANYSNVSSYCIRRFLSFCIPMLVVTSMSALKFYFFMGEALCPLLSEILKASILLSYSNLCSQAWCLRDFLISSLLIVILSGRKWTAWALAASAVILSLCGMVWVSVCLLGALVFHLNAYFQNGQYVHLIQSPLCQLLLAVISVWLIRRPEGNVSYLLQGIACGILFLIILNAPFVSRFLSWTPFAWLGRISFEAFLLHVLFYTTIHDMIAATLLAVFPAPVFFWVCLLLSLIATFIGAFLLNRLLRTKLFRLPYRLLDSPAAAKPEA